MKIWKGILQLHYNDNGYETRFDFKLQDKDYKFNEEYEQYNSINTGWVSDIIPSNMKVERSMCYTLKVIQGFDHDLNEEEKKQLEKDMREKMKEYLDFEKENMIKDFEMKMKAV